MAFLDWIKGRQQGRSAEPKAQPVERIYYTAKGNPILEISQGNWRAAPDGAQDYRRHVGQSVEGFHGGLEVANRGEHEIVWSNGRPTLEAAEKVSVRMQEGYEHGLGATDRQRELHAEWNHDQKLAKQRDDTGREPESGAVIDFPKPSKTEKRTPPKRVRVKEHDIPF